MKRQLLYKLLISMSGTAIIWALLSSQALAGTEKSPAATSDPNSINKTASKTGKIVATVDGEPIYAKDILSGMPPATFAGIDKYAQDMKLQRLIDEAKIRHFLSAQKIQVSPAEVDKAVDDYNKNPPGPGCACCRYRNLDEFLKATNFTLDEFRENIRLQKGMNAYFDRLWLQKYPDKISTSTLVNERRSEFEKKYFKLFQIRFLIKDFNNPDQSLADASKRANIAWTRLEKGELFEKVAKEVSDDKVSAEKGGCFGLMQFDSAWPAIAQLQFGITSKPVSDSYGYVIYKKCPITDDDMIPVLKDEFIRQKFNEVSAAIDANSVVRRL